MGLLNDPLGERLPDELWRQAAPEAEAELGGNDPKSIKSNYEFPADLIRHCEQEALEAVAADTAGLVRAVLRASGHAELVAERDIAWASNAGLTTDVLALRAKNAELVAALEGVVNDVQAWCDAIEKNGASWDDWDDHYKNFAYRGGLKRALAALAAARHKQGS
jgi:hypothetical protein